MVYHHIEASEHNGEPEDGWTSVLEPVPNHVVGVQSPYHVHQEHVGG